MPRAESPASPRPGRRDPRATRQALLDAGRSLFAERGYDGVPIGELAGRAGVNKALISYHFGGKRGLYRAILTTGFSEMAERLEAVVAAGGDARPALRGLVETFASVRRLRPEFPALFLREVLARGVEPAITPYLSRIVRATRAVAERGIDQGVFRRVDPMALHLALFGSFAFFIATEPARERAAAAGRVPAMPSFQAFRRYLEELTLRGLRPDRNSSSRPGRSRRKGARA